MTDDNAENEPDGGLTVAETQWASRLLTDPPRVSAALRRRVRHRIALSAGRKALRRRAMGLVLGGAVMTVVAIVLTVRLPA